MEPSATPLDPTRHPPDRPDQPDGPAIIPWTEHHAAGVVHVIRAVFAEYGVTFDESGMEADLVDIRRHYLDRGGAFAVLVDGGRVVGTVAALPDHQECEIKRVYLLPAYRGRGHGRALLHHILRWTAAEGHPTVIAWSDTRFTTAHRMYERMGFQLFGMRALDDPDQSREYGFRMPLDRGRQ